MLLQIGPSLRSGSKCYYGWDFYYAWVQMLLQMGPLLHLGPLITLVPSTARVAGGTDQASVVVFWRRCHVKIGIAALVAWQLRPGHNNPASSAGYV